MRPRASIWPRCFRLASSTSCTLDVRLATPKDQSRLSPRAGRLDPPAPVASTSPAKRYRRPTDHVGHDGQFRVPNRQLRLVFQSAGGAQPDARGFHEVRHVRAATASSQVLVAEAASFHFTPWTSAPKVNVYRVGWNWTEATLTRATRPTGQLARRQRRVEHGQWLAYDSTSARHSPIRMVDSTVSCTPLRRSRRGFACLRLARDGQPARAAADAWRRRARPDTQHQRLA